METPDPEKMGEENQKAVERLRQLAEEFEGVVQLESKLSPQQGLNEN